MAAKNAGIQLLGLHIRCQEYPLVGVQDRGSRKFALNTVLFDTKTDPRLYFWPTWTWRVRGGATHLSEIKVRENETFESALRRFNKKIKQNGVLSEVRRREHYEKPSVKRKKKIAAARKRKARSA